MRRKSRLREMLRFDAWRRKQILMVAGVTTAIVILLGLVTTVYFAASLSTKERLMNRNKTGVTLLDQSGKEFYNFYGARSNTHVTLDNIAPTVQKAAIAAEDKDFYDHPGFSVRGITAAIYENIRPNGLDSGGSTITQQLTRSALLSNDRNFLRKYQEIVLSIEIERRYSKDEILEMYLNSIYFGEGVFGIEDAAKVYFGKSAKDLTLAEASMLMGIIPAPAAYSPISGNPEFAKQRQAYVLGRMKEEKHISTEEELAAKSAELQYAPQTASELAKAPHFALMVKDELIERYGEEKIARSGYRVKTTLNLDWQAKAEAALTGRLNRLSDKTINGSAVIIDPRTGEIRALVGSRDWNNEQYGKVNMATSPRQPGSSFKPIMYSTGIEEGTLTAATILNDEPTDFGNYKPKNFDLRFRGDVTVRRALSNSLNVPAVQALQKVGVADTINSAKRMGITTIDKSPEHYGLSLTLGTAGIKLTELTNAYATFANQGKHNDLQTVASITNKNGREIYKGRPNTRQSISPQTSYIISSILSDNNARAESFGNLLTVSPQRPVAVKTGTTEDYRDALTVGYTPSLAVGVWMGNNDNTPMALGGSVGPAPVWRQIMQEILTNTPVEKFAQPSGVVAQPVCYGNGALAVAAGGNTYTEYFRSGILPRERCNEQKQDDDEAKEREKEEEKRRKEEEQRRQEEEQQQQEDDEQQLPVEEIPQPDENNPPEPPEPPVNTQQNPPLPTEQ